MPGPAPSVNSPFSRCGMPQANSTTSRPRWTSPLASAKVLPCSDERSLARLSNSRLHQLEKLEQHACAPLRIGGGPGRLRGLGVGDGVLDLGTCLANATLACTSPVLGLNTSPKRPDAPLHLLAADEMADLAHGSFSLKPNGVGAASHGHCAAFFRDGSRGPRRPPAAAMCRRPGQSEIPRQGFFAILPKPSWAQLARRPQPF